MLGFVRLPSRLAFTFVLSLAPLDAATAEERDAAEKTLAPYFFVEGGDPRVDRFPLESTEVDVAISGPIAAVTVTQVYGNQGARPIHARYVFPASTRAAVNGLRMALAGRVIEAAIQEREQAEKTFEAAKREGKTATLLDQQRPNVFTMRLANVMPGDRVEVTLRYTELLVPSEGRYAFVFPTVVGPRYANAAAGPSGFVAAPYLHAGEPAPAPVRIRGSIAAGIPVREVESATHVVAGDFDDDGVYRFELSADAVRDAGDRDFVLGIRLAGDAVETGLSLFDDGDEKFFLLLAMPPARVETGSIPPREFVFILDVSGSMTGFPLDTAKALMRDLVLPLRPSDRFNVLTFAGGSSLLSPTSLPATAGNVDHALAALDGEMGGGGTELLPALERALALTPEPGLARTFIVITDGLIEADDRALDFVSRHLGEANVFTFGIGSSVNRHLIEGLAAAGQGEPFVVLRPEEAGEAAARFARYVASPVLTDVRIDVEGFDVYALEPRSIPDVLAERPVVVMGKWRGEPRGELVVRGVTGAGAWEERIAVAERPPSSAHRALPLLWARTRIDALARHGLAEPGDDARAEILALGLRHRLLTRYTAFVAVLEADRDPREPGVDVDQPLPMPAGVSDAAVGVGAEPGLLVLAAIAAAALALRAGVRRAAAARAGRARNPRAGAAAGAA